MTLKKNIALLILAVLILSIGVQVGAHGVVVDRPIAPISDYLTHDVYTADGVSCIVIYMPLASELPAGRYPNVAGVSCDWDYEGAR